MELKQALVDSEVKIYRSFNRTIVELKHSSSTVFAVTVCAFNRTIVELKREWRVYLVGTLLTFNRTIVELKLKCAASFSAYCLPTFNRTIVELKQDEETYQAWMTERLLIEPLWN